MNISRFFPHCTIKENNEQLRTEVWLGDELVLWFRWELMIDKTNDEKEVLLREMGRVTETVGFKVKLEEIKIAKWIENLKKP